MGGMLGGLEKNDLPTRLKDMDKERIDVSVLFPTSSFAVNSMVERSYAVAYARAYNDFISEFCSQSPRLKAVALVPLQDPKAAVAEATRQVVAAPPTSQRVNLYYWYYGTLALHHRSQTSDASAAAWRAWNEALTAVLLEAQRADGPDAGSWDATTVWGGYGGRVYTTAMAAMCLEVYYRYAPQTPHARWTGRPGEASAHPR